MTRSVQHKLTLAYPQTYVPLSEQSPTDLAWMREALVMAEQALAAEEVPVGCVFVKDGQAIARARNRTNEWRNVSVIYTLALAVY
jgi:hypothetical protein